MAHDNCGFLRLGVALAATLSIGCTTAPAPSATWSMERTLVAEPAAVQAAHPSLGQAEALTVVSPGAAVQSGSRGGGAAAPASGHRLRIDLRGFLAGFSASAQRRVLATTADIDKLVLTVMHAGRADQTATLTREQIASGVAEFTFSELPAGNAIVLVVAYDQAGVPIGSAAQVVVISETSSSVAEMTVQLVPATPQSGPGGTLITKATFLDGPPPAPQPSGTVLMELDTIGVPNELVPAPGGGMFVGTALQTNQPSGNIYLSFFNTVVRVADDGTELFRSANYHAGPATYAYSPITGQLWATWRGSAIIDADGTQAGLYINTARFALDALGNAYGADNFKRNDPIFKVTPSGAKTATSMAGNSALAFDAAGNLWTAWVDGGTLPRSLRRYAPDESLLGTAEVPGPIFRVTAAPRGDVWVMHGAESDSEVPSSAAGAPYISRFAADGTLLGTYDITASQLAFDAQGNVWAAGEVLTKLTPEGRVLATYPHFCWSVAMDALGYVWVGTRNELGGGTVLKLHP